jgi:PAS domain S-box-containing protein
MPEDTSNPSARHGATFARRASTANVRSGSELPQTPEQRDHLFRQLVLGVRDYAIFLLDPSGCITSWNPGAERIKGYRAEEIIGRHFSVFYPEESLARDWPRQELELARQQGRFEDEGWRLRKGGSRFWANVVITALHDDDGRFIGFAKITRDLTERKSAEESLRAAHDQLERRVEERTRELSATNEMLRSEIGRRTALERELRQLGIELARQLRELGEADRRKNEFLAMLAHELRNPMAPIVNGLEILSASSPDAGANFTLERMQRQMRVLVRLVEDLLDVSRLVQGRIELRRQRLELTELVKSALETAGPEIDAHRHQIAVSLPEHPVSLDGDQVRLAQVLSNLLVNAAKYSDQPGRIDLEGNRVGDIVEIRVRDQGIGIAPELLPKIFDLFTQADRSLDRSRGGLGIGLTLARRLVELHGGVLTASSQGIGHGSEFVIRLPVTAGGEVGAPRSVDLKTVPVTGASRRVLVIDDSVDAAESTAALVRFWGHQAKVLHSGEGAVREVETFRPHVVLLDIGLPGKDGYEVARELRRLDPTRSLVIAAVTGYGMEEDRRRSDQAGFDYHFVKPIDLELLKTILSS